MGDCWYENGLRFTCTGCGSCCRGPGGYVWVEDDEIRALAAAVGMELEAFGRRYLRRVGLKLALIDGPQGDCIFLGGNGRCSVYEARPVQCRTFPWWPEVVMDSGTWEQAGRDCPGIGNGKLHDLRTIRSGLAES